MHKKSFDTVHNNNAQYYFIKEKYLFSNISISYENVLLLKKFTVVKIVIVKINQTYFKIR